MLTVWRIDRLAGPRSKGVLLGMATLVCLAALASPAFGHPDLVLQIERLDEQIKSGQVSADLYLQRGDLYRRHEDFERAAQNFTAARQLDPKHAMLDFYEGWLFLDSGEPASAEMHLARYLAVNPQHAKAWVLRGQANIQLAHLEQAAGCFGEAIAHSENPSPELYRLHILSTLAIGQSAWEPAAHIAANGVERFGTEVTVLGLAIDIALAMNQPQQAAAYLDRLPSALKGLPQWAERFGILRCFDSRETIDSGECQSQADKAIDERVKALFQPG